MNTDEHGSEIRNKFFRSVFICVHLWLFFSSLASAHPLPNLRFDRTVHVRLSPDAATVRYTLELNDWTMVLDGKNLVTPADVQANPGQLGFARSYAGKKAPLIADGLRATLDGKDVPFTVEKTEVEPERDHVRLRLLLRSPWTPEPGKPHIFAFEDQNFEDRSGAVTLTLDRSGKEIDITEQEEPTGLRQKSPLELTPDEATRLRKAGATFVLSVASGGRQPPEEPQRPDQSAKPSPPQGPGNGNASGGLRPPLAADAEPPSVVVGLADRGLTALFDTGYGLGVLLLLATGFGAAHAFTPGHGKTLVAAYLVGERGTVRHAVVLGLVTTVAHTGSVIVVAAVLRGYYGDTIPAATEAVLKVLGGLLIFGVGLWLFGQRVRGRADHVHLFGDHHHHHGGNDEFGMMNDESKATDPTGSSVRHSSFRIHRSSLLRVILLGLGGGIVPCWDAVLLLLVAASAGRLGIAVPLLLAFSAGLASVLVGLGIGVVFAHRVGGRSFGEARWFRALPVVSAMLLVGLGVWFLRDGARTLLGL